MKLIAVMITISFLILTSCLAPSKTISSYSIDKTEFVNDLNASIIEGFYNNDTTGISESIYLLK
jgi:hypothetical protein